MTTDNDVIRQLTELREGLKREAEKREEAENECIEKIKMLEERTTRTEQFIAYMRGTATKWGSALMGALALGTIIAMGVDKLKERIINWIFP